MHSEYVAPGVSSTYSFTLGKALRAEVRCIGAICNNFWSARCRNPGKRFGIYELYVSPV